MPDVDMSLIREAMARRARGDIGGGTTTPAAGQMTAPTGETPVGGPNTPTVPPPGEPVPGGAPAQPPAAQPVNQGLQAGGEAQSPQFDEETRVLGKALIAKLLKVL